MSAEERRHEILDAAVAEFAVKGLHGTSTEAIAKRAGVSQPYLFRLFRTKKDLFIATAHRGFDDVQRTFEEAAAAENDDVLKAMGLAYRGLLAKRQDLLLQLHCYAACSDPDIEEAVRERFGQLYRYVQEVSNAPSEVMQTFFANGMLLNVAAAMNLIQSGIGEDWLSECLSSATG
ncbi:MAG TPA: TetR/AcrR family transcriptional regulator [Chloroflexota bacterium]|nr:TetR/AcrR family transcriptional regulator [Chloroflexota bacterium]